MNILPFLNTTWWEINKGHILQLADAIVFLLLAICVLYLLLFAIMSLTKSKLEYDVSRKKHRFIVLFLVQPNDDNAILDSIAEFITQDYSCEKYDIIVGYNGLQDNTIKELEELGVITYYLENSYNAGNSLKMIAADIPEKSYDMMILFNANDSVEPNFLNQINNAFYSGCLAIQTHRVPMHFHGLGGRLSSFSEELNNSIFRKGHVNLGFSSALNSSGLALDFKWIKENAHKLGEKDVIKQLETSLLKQKVYIEYLNETYTFMGETNSKVMGLQGRHVRWMKDANKNLLKELPRLPLHFFRGNWDYCDKIVQWAIPSRVSLTFIITIFTLGLFIFDWTMSIKWGILLVLLFITFSIAAPDKLINKNNYEKSSKH